MSDRELLELAAKAAGYRLDADGDRADERNNAGAPIRWNPLTDDGDALRLAVKLRLDISKRPDDVVEVSNNSETLDEFRWAWESYGVDPYAATRRAIVRAAAQIGGDMP